MRVDALLVLVSRVFGRDFERRPFILKVHQQHRISKLRLDLLRIEHMEQDHFIPAIPQRLDSLDDSLGLFVKIRQYNDEAAPMLKVLEMNKRLDEIGAYARPRLGLFDGVKQTEELPLARGRRNVIDDIVAEDQQPRRIALLIPHIDKRRSDEASIIELAHAVRRISHRGRGIEQNQQLRIGLAAVPLEKALAGAGKNVPINVPEIVPLRVSAVLCEFLGEPEIRRTM